jgi:Transposase IS4
MPRARFFELQKYMHFDDNTTATQNRDDPLYDRYHEVRPIKIMLRRACLITEPEAKQIVDEQMIPYKGKNSLRQYLPTKAEETELQSICEVRSQRPYV